MNRVDIFAKERYASNKKIGIDVRCLMNKKYSGVSWYTFNLLNKLFEIDQENEYILFYNSSKKVCVPEFKYDNVSYKKFNYPNKIFNLLLNFFNWPKIDKMIGGVDVFFVPNLHFISLSNKCKKIITIHDLSFIRFPEFFNWKMRLWHHLILIKKIVNRADIIIADSKNTKVDLIELLNIKEQKIKINYLGVEDRFMILNDLNSIRKKYNLPNKFILYLGTLEPRKNIESILEAYNKMDTEYCFVICGESGWKTKKIYQLANNNKKIYFTGYVDEVDKPAFYNLASLFIYPSYYEGFGLPILEAMACGTPVIAGSNSSQVEIVGNAGLLIDPYNVNEIKKAMELIINNKNLRDKFIQLGLERAKDFRWENTARKLLENFK